MKLVCSALIDVDEVRDLWRDIAGDDVPTWAVAVVAILALVVLVWTRLSPIVSDLASVWRSQVAPRLKLDPGSAQAARSRRHLASKIVDRVEGLAHTEHWMDERYTELEARVVEDKRHVGSWSASSSRRRSGRVERSLGRMLVRTRHQCVWLTGDPGSGKSVALRHATAQLARRAAHSRDPDHVLPIYVNLRDYAPEGGPSVGSLRELVKRSLIGEATAHDAEYIERVFEPGFATKSWILLFDSFDEIPAVLGSTGADGMVTLHQKVIADYVAEEGCRVVVAGRELLTSLLPKWVLLRVLELTPRRQVELVRRAGLAAVARGALLAWLREVDGRLRRLVSNPLFLNLVCEQARQGGDLPRTSHDVFDRFISQRLDRDEASVRDRFQVESVDARDLAQRIAFLIGDRQLSLDADIAEVAHVLGDDLAELRRGLGALEHVRLVAVSPDGARVRFVHRRFQEYFATCAFIEGGGSVSADRLVDDGRWRETAVTIMQTRPMTEMGELIDLLVSRLERGADHPVGKDWPPELLALLDLVERGLAGRRDDVPAELRAVVSRILAGRPSGLAHLKWSVEVSGCCDEATREELLGTAFARGGEWTRAAALASALRYGVAGRPVRSLMATSFLTMARHGTLRWSYHWLDRRLQILRDRGLRHVLRWARFAPWIDLVAAASLLVMYAVISDGRLVGVAAVLTGLAHLGGYGSRDEVAGRVEELDATGLGGIVNRSAEVAFWLDGIRYPAGVAIPLLLFFGPGVSVGAYLFLAATTFYWILWWSSLDAVAQRWPDGGAWRFALAPFVEAWVSANGIGLRRLVRQAPSYLAGFAAMVLLLRYDRSGRSIILVAAGFVALFASVLLFSSSTYWYWRRTYLRDAPAAVSLPAVLTTVVVERSPYRGAVILRAVRASGRMALGADDPQLLRDFVALVDQPMDGTDDDRSVLRERVRGLAVLLDCDAGEIRRCVLSVDEIEELCRWIEETRYAAVVEPT